MQYPPPETHYIAMFGGAEIQRWPAPEPLPQEGQDLLAGFLALPPETLRPVARHVYAFYRDMMEVLNGEGWPGHPLPQIETADEVWPHVTPVAIDLHQGSHADDAWYVGIEAKIPWEVEHSLHMIWRNGTDIAKVGPVDGHVTNADAYDDDRLLDVVYKATNPKWTTRRDG